MRFSFSQSCLSFPSHNNLLSYLPQKLSKDSTLCSKKFTILQKLSALVAVTVVYLGLRNILEQRVGDHDFRRADLL